MASLKEPISNQTDVALQITKQLLVTGEGKNQNMVYSPLSIHVALSLLAAGSKGCTLNQLLSFLKSKSTDQLNSLASDLLPLLSADESPSGGPHVRCANGIWVEKTTPLKPCFKEVVDSAYKAALKEVDFRNNFQQVGMEVNSWAEKETNGLIKQVLPPDSVDDLTRVIFANALYFKAFWSQKFHPIMTEKRDFHLLNGNVVKAPIMVRDYEEEFVRVFDGFKVLERPYQQGLIHTNKGRQFSMCFFLPDANDGLPYLEQKLCTEPGFLDRHFPYERALVSILGIPKFKISCGFDASQVVKDLGLVLPFSEVEAEITEMVEALPGEEPYYVDGIHHGSFIEVTEEGTEAGAVTFPTVKGFGTPFAYEFVADHPFLFLIREQITGTVLFIGHVLNPLQG